MTAAAKRVFGPFGPKTNAQRQKEYRDRQREADAIALTTEEIVGIAARLVDGRADRRDALAAAALLLRFMRSLPADGSVSVTLSH